MKEWKPDPNAWVEEQLEKKARNGDIAYRARRDSCSYAEAMVSLFEELDAPFKAIKEKYARRRAERDSTLDEEEVDRRARSYATVHGVSYPIALEAVLPSTPGAKTVELKEPAPVDPGVDDTDAAINRRAESYAARNDVSFSAALTAVLREEGA